MPKVSQAAKKLSSAQSAYIGSSKGIAGNELNIKNIYDTLALDQEQLGRRTFAASLGLTALDALGIDDAKKGQKIIQEESAKEAYGEELKLEKETAYESYVNKLDSESFTDLGTYSYNKEDETWKYAKTEGADLSTDISKADPSMVKQFEQTTDFSPSWDEFKETDAYSKYLEGFKATSTKEGLFGKYGATSWFSPKKYGDKEFSYKQARKTGKLFGEGGMFGDQELFDLLEDRMGGAMSLGDYPSLDKVSGGKLTSTFAKEIQNNLGDGDWSDLNKIWNEKDYTKKFGIDYTTFSTRYKKSNGQ